MSRGWPSKLEFVVKCDEVRTSDRVNLLETGGLTVSREGKGDRISLETAGSPSLGSKFEPGPDTRATVSLRVPASECRVTGGFREEDASIWLQIGERYVSREVSQKAFPKVTELGPSGGAARHGNGVPRVR